MPSKVVLDAIAGVNKKLNGEVLTVGFANEDCPRVPFTSVTLNYMTHGGLPRGRICEFFGLESSGKTTTALDVMGNLSRILKEEGSDKVIVYADLEQTLTPDRCELFGIDPSETLLLKPDYTQSAEDILNAIIELLKKHVVGGFVLDSVPALVPKDEWDKQLSEDPKRGGVAAQMTRFMREATPLVAHDNVMGIVVNQMRDGMSPYQPYTTPGGKAIKFFSAVRMLFSKGHLLDADGNELSGNTETSWGNIVKVRIEKAKAFPPDRLLGQYPLMYYSGIDKELDLAWLMLATRNITQAGSWFAIVDQDGTLQVDDQGKVAKAQGFGKIVALLRENPNLRKKFEDLFK